MSAIKFVKLSFTEVPAGYVVSGYDTFNLKDDIKAAGGKWNATSKAWTIPADSLDTVRACGLRLSDQRAAERKEAAAALKAKRAFDATPEGQALLKKAAKEKVLWALQQKKATGAYHWICCEECEVIDWSRQHTSCHPCGSGEGVFRNTFRVRGRLYTGD